MIRDLPSGERLVTVGLESGPFQARCLFIHETGTVLADTEKDAIETLASRFRTLAVELENLARSLK